jgi:hypothetical protein
MITVVATDTTVAILSRLLSGIGGVLQSELDEWTNTLWSLDAPFNPWQSDQRLRALTTVFPATVTRIIIQQLVNTLSTSPHGEVLLIDPATGSTIGRIGQEVSADQVADLVERAALLETVDAAVNTTVGQDVDVSQRNMLEPKGPDPELVKPGGSPEFYFVLEGDRVKQDFAAAPSDFDLVFNYDAVPDDALSVVDGDELERQRQAPDGGIDLLISLEGNLRLRKGGLPFGRAEFDKGSLKAPVRFLLHAHAPGEARVRVSFAVNGATIYNLVLDIHLVSQIDEAIPLRRPLPIDLDAITRGERVHRDVKLLINDTGGGWQVSFFWDKQYGLVPTEIKNLNPGQLHDELESIKPLLETVAKSPVWKNFQADLSMSSATIVPRQINGKLLTAGWRLYKVLAESDFGEYIRRIESLPWGSKISIETKSAFIPWEILYPLEYNEDEWPDDHPLKSQNYDPERLWGNRFQIEVLLMPEKSKDIPAPLQPPPAKVSMIIGNTVASGEISGGPLEWQKDYFERRLSNMGELLTENDKIRKVFITPKYPATFIYLLCHGRSKNPPTVVDDMLEFDKDFIMTPNSVVMEYDYLQRPLIFVNSCSVGAISPLAFTSFLRAFLKKEAFGLIASSFSLPTRFAAAFGQKLLDGYLDNRPVGEVLFNLRCELYEKGIPLGMFYSLQCPLDVTAPHYAGKVAGS